MRSGSVTTKFRVNRIFEILQTFQQAPVLHDSRGRCFVRSLVAARPLMLGKTVPSVDLLRGSCTVKLPVPSDEPDSPPAIRRAQGRDHMFRILHRQTNNLRTVLVIHTSCRNLREHRTRFHWSDMLRTRPRQTSLSGSESGRN